MHEYGPWVIIFWWRSWYDRQWVFKIGVGSKHVQNWNSSFLLNKRHLLKPFCYAFNNPRRHFKNYSAPKAWNLILRSKDSPILHCYPRSRGRYQKMSSSSQRRLSNLRVNLRLSRVSIDLRSCLLTNRRDLNYFESLLQLEVFFSQLQCLLLSRCWMKI